MCHSVISAAVAHNSVGTSRIPMSGAVRRQNRQVSVATGTSVPGASEHALVALPSPMLWEALALQGLSVCLR